MAGEGHNVGTLYIDVVPRLNQAAMQQVAQQAQGAAGGGRFGGGGGGGIGGGSPMMNPAGGGGGGGYSTNNVVIQNIVNNAFRAPQATGGGALGDGSSLASPTPDDAAGVSFGSRAYNFMGGARGFRRAGYQAFFGAAEAGRAYLASRRPGQVEERGGTEMAVLNASRASLDSQAGGFFMAPVAAFAQAGSALLGGSDLITDTYSAIDSAERGVRDVNAGAQRLIAAGDSGRAARLTRANSSRYNFVGATERAVHDVATRGLGDTLVRLSKLEDYKYRIAAASGDERDNLIKDRNTYASTSAEELKASGRRDTLEIADIRRKAGLDATSIQGQGDVFGLMARGRFGAAEDVHFQNQQDDAQRQADAAGAAQGAAQARTNAYAGAARHSVQGRAATRAYENTRAMNAMAKGDVLGSMAITAARDRADAVTDAPPGFASVYGDEADAKSNLARTRYTNDRADVTSDLARRLQSSRILASKSVSFATAGHIAEAYGISQGGIDRSDSLNRRGLKDDADTVRATAKSDMEVLKRQYLASFAPQEVDINRVSLSGAGSADIASILRSIDDGIKKLNASGVGATAQ